MAQGSIIKAGIHSDEANLPKRGFPVSIKDDMIMGKEFFHFIVKVQYL